VGIEHLSIHFPWSPYPGHFKEKGYNALFFQDVSHSWINDVEIQNADFGVDLSSTNFCTVNNVTLTVSKSRAVRRRSARLEWPSWNRQRHGTENLITRFDVQTKFVHDISVEWYGAAHGLCQWPRHRLNMDHHREANYSSLFSNLDCAAGTRPFNSGGSGNRGAHSGAYKHLLEHSRRRPGGQLPPNDFGPALEFHRSRLETQRICLTYLWLIERLSPKTCVQLSCKTQ